jgi:microcompartment protein CcmL/EutN
VAVGDALGLIETRGLVAAFEAADAMLKAANVRMVSRTRTNAALITIAVVGDVGAVQAAVDAGRVAAERVGHVLAAHVIARPGEGVVEKLLAGAAPRAAAEPAASPSSRRPEPDAPAEGRSADELDAMTVRELRSLARERDDLHDVAGRTISRATKDELVALLKRS